MMKLKCFWLLACVFYCTSFAAAQTYTTCFTPGRNCTGLIIQHIQQANTSIYIQAYSFTSKPIAQALARSAKKGVKVNIIVDKTNENADSHSVATWLSRQGIPIWVDYRPSIAHNKVMIIDNHTVITGSFNFTRAAQISNAENVIIIRDAVVAEQYLANWKRRQAVSRAIHAKHKQNTWDTELLRWLKKELYHLLNRLFRQAIQMATST